MGLLSAKTRGRNMKKDNKKNHVFFIFGSKQPKDSSTPQSLISFILRQNSVNAQRMLEPTAGQLGGRKVSLLTWGHTVFYNSHNIHLC